MWDEILMLAIGNGLWAVMSCLLLSYLLRDSKKREAKYTAIIEDLADKLKIVAEIRKEVSNLSDRVDNFAFNSALGSAGVKTVTLPKTRSKARPPEPL